MSNVAAKAILRSVSHSEIVTIPFDGDALAYLERRCEGSAETDSVREFWGTTDEGQEWRVHMRRLTDEQVDARFARAY